MGDIDDQEMEMQQSGLSDSDSGFWLILNNSGDKVQGEKKWATDSLIHPAENEEGIICQIMSI